MKKYTIYQFKKALIPFAVIAFAGIILYVIPLLIPTTPNSFSGSVESYSSILALVLIAACVLMPVWAFRYKMNKRSTDLYFSLPIKRHKLLIIHFLSGFAAIVAGYTAAFWIGFIVIAVKSQGLELINMLWLYLSSIVAAYAVYSIYGFVYTRANNTIDGLIFMAFATFAVMAITIFIYTFAQTEYLVERVDPDGYAYSYYRTTYYVLPEYFMPFMPMIVLQGHFTELTVYGSSSYFRPFSQSSYIAIENANIIVSFAIYAVLSALSTVGIYQLEKRNVSENCEQVSDSIFGYRVMIPLFEFTLCAWAMTELSAIVVIFFAAAGYFLTAIWKRTFKIGWRAFIVLAVSIAAGLAAGYIISCFI